MKFALCSDLHLEFADIILKNDEQADVLVLSGDICVARELPYSDSPQGQKFRDFFRRCAFEFPNVIYVMGNHEHYHGDYQETAKLIKNEVAQYPHFYFLDKDTVEINGVTFIGGTLWTDMNKEDPVTLFTIQKMMNDFQIITNSARTIGSSNNPARFLPDDAVEDHKKMVDFIDQVIVADKIIGIDGKYVVVGHHAPSKRSTKPRYQDDTIMNGGYSSELTEFILDRPEIKFWTHGHTHDEFDYNIGNTRVVCNPRGYDGYEDRADSFKLKYYTV